MAWLAAVDDLSNTRWLQQEIAALEDHLQRCQQALTSLKYQIERYYLG